MKAPVWSISQLVEAIRARLSSDPQLTQVLVQGEVGNFTENSASLHWYFTLKDSAAAIRCVMFSRFHQGMTYRPKAGDTVIVQGAVNIYQPRGDMQLVVYQMLPQGQGSFYAQFEKTRRKLEPLGWFDPARKKPLPPYPDQISVVTGANTAALQDIRITIARRWPCVRLIENYATVQGEEAVESIVNALKRSDQDGSDVIILARGGGSVDDLWCFNDERIAAAIHELKTPIVTGIGHEIDTTIADLVADVRAATPTAAAQAATPDGPALLKQVQEAVKQMRDTLALRLMERSQTLDHDTAVLQGFANRIANARQQAANYRSLLYLSLSKLRDDRRQSLRYTDALFARSLNAVSRAAGLRLQQSRSQLAAAIDGFRRQQQQEYRLVVQQLEALSPLTTLARGYVVSQQDGRVLHSAAEVDMERSLTLRYRDGTVQARPERRSKHGPNGEPE